MAVYYNEIDTFAAAWLRLPTSHDTIAQHGQSHRLQECPDPERYQQRLGGGEPLYTVVGAAPADSP